MKIAIVYESKTGNTKLIAESLKEELNKGNTIIFESVEQAMQNNTAKEEIDLYLLGSWTYKGDCGDKMKEFCALLNQEKIAIFGTAGFGGSDEYYRSLAERFASTLLENNKVLGSFYCQGKMPMSIRDRYVSMLTKNPEDAKLKVNIENFDDASTHPDEDDMRNTKVFANKMLEKL